MGKKRQVSAVTAMPDFARVPLAQIMEPELPARASMDIEKMRELVESMRELGQIEPITLERRGEGYQIITGHRRFMAARDLGWTQISALVYKEGSANKLGMMLHENVVRESLNPAEEALFMAEAKERMQLDEAGLVAMFHRTPDYIAGRFALLRGDPDIFGAVQKGEIKLGVAHHLNRISDEGMRHYYLDAAKRSDPPARVVQQWVADWQAQTRGRSMFATPAGGENGVSSAPSIGAAGVGDGDGAAPESVDAAPSPSFGCELCGGTKDPYNLVNVRLHKWEWEQIQAQVEKAARGL